MNKFKLDKTYFSKWLNRVIGDLGSYTPDEFARALARMARTADADVLDEREFAGKHLEKIAAQALRIEALEVARNDLLMAQFGVPPVATWPEWANWCALDLSNNWVFYEQKPTMTNVGPLTCGGAWGKPRVCHARISWSPEHLYDRAILSKAPVGDLHEMHS